MRARGHDRVEPGDLAIVPEAYGVAAEPLRPALIALHVRPREVVVAGGEAAQRTLPARVYGADPAGDLSGGAAAT